MTSSTFKTKALLTSVITMLVLSVTLIGATFVAAAPPSIAVNLDQCRNGKLTDPQDSVTPCTGNGSGNSGWVNGNAGASNAHFSEGESISYRARLTNLHVGDQVALIMAYDVIHSGKDAIDYLTDKNRWQLPETTVADNPDVPCSGVTDCGDLVPDSTIDILPPETNLQVDTSKTLADGCQTVGDGATQQPLTSFNAVATAGQAKMELFGGSNGTFEYVGPDPVLTDHTGTQQQQVKVTFTATAANPVLAWGGHIASRLDWGCDGAPQSASGISGSPYHMAINSALVDGTPVNLGNQDRSLSAAAVIFVQPAITTTLSATTGFVGDSITDGATLSGNTADAGGTVTYTVYSDAGCSTVYASGGTKPVTNGVVTDSDPVTFNAAGTYYWQVVYSGDAHNATATSACNSEIVTISKRSPTASTAQNLVPNDTFTLSGASSDASGTVDFYLFSPSQTCAVANIGTAAYHFTGTISSGSASTSNTTAVTTAGTWKWYVTWAGDTKNNGAVSNCVESFTINNG